MALGLRLADGNERPIAFASRMLHSSVQNYSKLEKEALSLIFGVKKSMNIFMGDVSL